MPRLARRGTPGKHADLLCEIARIDLAEHALSARWSSDGSLLAAVPSQGEIIMFDVKTNFKRSLPGHGFDNACAAWHPFQNRLATCGQDGMIRIYDGSADSSHPVLEIPVGAGWIESIAWNCDGSFLAVGVDRTLRIFDQASGELARSYDAHKSTVCDLSWNPTRSDEIATVCDGGAFMWRIGESEPFGSFDWGGASLKVLWSPGGRWVVTGDQTPSVHIYDVPSGTPFHIQGYQTKVRALAWEDQGEWLATGGGETISVWPCTGTDGPNGATPIDLVGHRGKVCALDFAPGQPILASGDDEGVALLWLPLKKSSPGLLAQEDSEITDIQFSPDSTLLAIGTADGAVSIRSLTIATKQAQ